MKINIEKYPALEKIYKGEFGRVMVTASDADTCPPGSDVLALFRETFNANCEAFRKSVRYISAPLHEAIILAREKMLTADVLTTMASTCGTFVVGEYVYCFNIKTRGGDINWDYVCYAFRGDSFVAFSADDSDYSYNWASDAPFGHPANDDERKNMARGVFAEVLLIINFLRYAEIETKYLPSNRQIWDGARCLYNNKLKYPIEIIDSTWFTTLVKSDAFKVRGHFRLQPFGEGLSKKKLVWINEFQKHGYTRKAKKITAIP